MCGYIICKLYISSYIVSVSNSHARLCCGQQWTYAWIWMWAWWSRCMDNYCCEIIVQWKVSLVIGVGWVVFAQVMHNILAKETPYLRNIYDTISNNFRYFLTPSSVSFWEYVWQISLHHGQFCTQGTEHIPWWQCVHGSLSYNCLALLFLSFWVVLPYIVDQIGNQVSWFPHLRNVCHLGSLTHAPIDLGRSL